MRRPLWVGVAVAVVILAIVLIWNPLVYLLGGFLPIATLLLLLLVPFVLGLLVGFLLSHRGLPAGPGAGSRLGPRP